MFQTKNDKNKYEYKESKNSSNSSNTTDLKLTEDWLDDTSYTSSGWEEIYDINLASNGLKNSGGKKIQKHQGISKKRTTKSDIKSKKLVYHSKGARKKLSQMKQN